MEKKTMLPLVPFFIILLVKLGDSTTFTIKNNCRFTVWPGTLGGGSSPQLSQTGFQLDNGASTTLNIPAKWSGRVWGRRGCSVDASGKFSCQSGDCGSGQVACNGAGGATPATLVEFTLNGDSGKDFYDVSLVDGFNLPVYLAINGGSGDCKVTSCPVDINARCPGELRVTVDGAVVGCKSPCEAFNTDQYCCRGAYGGPATCTPSTYAQSFKAACPLAYSYAYDDLTSTFTCTGANYAITFCP